MKTINQILPIFKKDQVLTASHLNDLRSYLDRQNRMTRTHLIGVGIVCGLELEYGENYIKITEGLGVTSKGYLIGIPESNCVSIRDYKDKKKETTDDEDDKVAGYYDPFIDPESEDDNQIRLWELLTNEEKNKSEIDTYSLNREAESSIADLDINLSDYCVLLYLEIEDKDDDCCGDDCDEEGIQRNFTVRKLLIKKEHLNLFSHGEPVSELNDRYEDVNACSVSPDICIERLGYYPDERNFLEEREETGVVNDLSLNNFDRFSDLIRCYTPIIKKSSRRISEALVNSYSLFNPILDTHLEIPFQDEDGLFSLIADKTNKRWYAIQYVYDFLKDLIDAYDEFRDAACEVMAVCCPDTSEFKRHLMLGPAKEEQNSKRTAFRHYFRPSPILNGQKDKQKKASLLFERLVKMIQAFHIPEEKPIKITPDRTADHPLSNRSIPYYYDVEEQLDLVKSWNYKKTKLFKWNQIPSYYSEVYNKIEGEENAYKHKCTVEANLNTHSHQHYRVEGHIGKQYNDAVEKIDGLREKLNLPFKVVGVKLSHDFDNSELSYECRFDDLENLYETYRTELYCLLDEEETFFRNLEIPQRSDERTITGKVTDANSGEPLPGVNILVEGTAQGTVTNAEGVYELTVPPSSDTLYFSFIGYGIQAVPIWGRNEINFELGAAQYWGGIAPHIKLAEDIRQLINELTVRLEDLNIREVGEAYRALMLTTRELKDFLKGGDNDVHELSVKQQMILLRLEKLINSCSIKKLEKLYEIYLQRVEEIKELNLFSNFASRHSGLEHMAGVPKGGTLVLVYVDQNEEPVLSDVAAEEIEHFVEKEKAWKRKRYLKTKIKKQRKAKVLSGLKEAAKQEGYELNENQLLMIEHQLSEAEISIEERELSEQPPDNVVVADFALPYLCKSDCRELATMVISQISFSLPEDRFCKDDETRYPFTTDPVGGVVESTAAGISSEGNTWYFQPAASDPDGEDVQFTYQVNNQTVVFNIKVFNPQAEFAYEKIQLDNGKFGIKFYNHSRGAQSYEWDFGDGTDSTKYDPPVHDYTEYEGDEVSVTLTVKKGKCSDQFEDTIKIPKQEETEFDLETPSGRSEKVYCNTDETRYQFTTEPEGGKVTGDEVSGVVEENGVWYFKPLNHKPGEFTFKYLDETLDIKVLQGPKNIDYGRSTEIGYQETKIVFYYSGEDVKQISWTIDGEKYTGEEAVHTFYRENRDESHEMVLNVTSENGCTVTIEKSLEVEFQQEPVRIEKGIENHSKKVNRYKKPQMDNKLFGGENPLLNKVANFLTGFKEKLQDEDTRKKYEEGEMNLDIAKDYQTMLSDTAATMKEKGEVTGEEEKAYLSGIYNLQLEQLLELAVRQKKDIRGNSKMGQVLKSVENQVKDLRDIGFEIDAEKSLSEKVVKTKNEAKRTDMKYFERLLDNLSKALKYRE